MLGYGLPAQSLRGNPACCLEAARYAAYLKMPPVWIAWVGWSLRNRVTGIGRMLILHSLQLLACNCSHNCSIGALHARCHMSETQLQFCINLRAMAITVHMDSLLDKSVSQHTYIRNEVVTPSLLLLCNAMRTHHSFAGDCIEHVALTDQRPSGTTAAMHTVSTFQQGFTGNPADVPTIPQTTHTPPPPPFL